MNYCVSCHGVDKNGDEPVYPSLVGLQTKMKKEDVLNKIKQGGGKMPAFESILKGHEEAIIAFLFDKKDKKLSQKEADLLEIQRNKLSQKAAAADDEAPDTAAIYLNVTAYGHFRDPEGRPGIKPPWGMLHAINLHTGEYVWQIPLGNHPELQSTGAPETGSEGSAGPIVTAGGLVFIGGTKDKKLRALDKDTGKLIWETTLPAVANATACTYSWKQKQYIAISVSGDKENPAGYIMAFALP